MTYNLLNPDGAEAATSTDYFATSYLNTFLRSVALRYAYLTSPEGRDKTYEEKLRGDPPTKVELVMDRLFQDRFVGIQTRERRKKTYTF